MGSYRVRLYQKSGPLVWEVEAADIEEAFGAAGQDIMDGDYIEVSQSLPGQSARAMITGDPYELVATGDVEDQELNWRTREPGEHYDWIEQVPLGIMFLF